jgi:hypothetical protein
MGMQQVSNTKIDVNFECSKCERMTQLSINDAVSDGAPMCCEEKMLMVDAEVNSQMVFA